MEKTAYLAEDLQVLRGFNVVRDRAKGYDKNINDAALDSCQDDKNSKDFDCQNARKVSDKAE